MHTITTTQGQAWDQIAKTEWGDERLLHHLMEANPHLVDVVLFSGGETVAVPDLADEDIFGVSLPPWKQS